LLGPLQVEFRCWFSQTRLIQSIGHFAALSGRHHNGPLTFQGSKRKAFSLSNSSINFQFTSIDRITTFFTVSKRFDFKRKQLDTDFRATTPPNPPGLVSPSSPFCRFHILLSFSQIDYVRINLLISFFFAAKIIWTLGTWTMLSNKEKSHNKENSDATKASSSASGSGSTGNEDDAVKKALEEEAAIMNQFKVHNLISFRI
jgi:hypothetical protein